MEAIVSQLMEKQRLARSGGGVGPVPVAVNGHNLPQRQQQQQLQTTGVVGGGGRGSNNSRLSNNAMDPQVQQVHHNHKVGADVSSLNDLAAGHSLPHSLRRLSNGGAGSSFIRLEPRPAPMSHSNTIQQQQQQQQQQQRQVPCVQRKSLVKPTGNAISFLILFHLL